MDYEQRYKEALERARKIKNRESIDVPNGTSIPVAIFPELKESEDERMRKSIIYALRNGGFYDNDKTDEAIAWLEKQGEQKSVEDSLTLEEFENAFITKAKQYDIDLPNRSWDIYALCKELYSLKHKPKQGEKNPAEWHIEDEQNLNVCLDYIPDEFLRRWLIDVIHAKYDKPIDKLEPKFNLYDWVVTDKGDTVQIGAVNNGYYTLFNGMDFNISYVDKCWHKWTIKDAKDGDVLCSLFHHLIWIYKDSGQYYACVNMNYTTENINTNGLISIPNDVRPATKDEQTILFEKMREAGYKWNANKKELIKL